MMDKIEFYSSVGGAGFIEKLLREWSQMGLSTQTFHAVTSADYRNSRGGLSRTALRWRMYGGFGWICWRAARLGRNNGGFRVVTTNPFFLPALVRRTAGVRGPTIQLLYDLYPDTLIKAGLCSQDSLVARWCARLTRYSLRECAATVFLGERLRAHAEVNYGPARRAVVIPVGADGGPFREHEPVALEDGAKPVILYCGQMGRMHEVDTLMAILPTGVARHYAWRFHAGGNGYARLCKHSGTLPDVIYGGHLSDAEWRAAMLSASIALVTIMRGGEKVVMPSKTYSALVAGQAILAVCVRESDLADLVIEHDCGWVIEPGDRAGLAALLARLAKQPDEVLAKRRNAYRAGHEFYDMVPVAKQWLKLFQELENERGQGLRPVEVGS